MDCDFDGDRKKDCRVETPTGDKLSSCVWRSLPALIFSRFVLSHFKFVIPPFKSKAKRGNILGVGSAVNVDLCLLASLLYGRLKSGVCRVSLFVG